MLALLRTGRLADARQACAQLSIAASACHPTGPACAFRDVAGNAGARPAVIAAMRAFPHDLQLQRHGSLALGALCSGHAMNCGCSRTLTPADATSRLCAFNHGAVEVLVAAVRTHAASDGTLCAAACHALWLLYDDKRAVQRSAAAATHADAAVGALLRAHDAQRADEDVQHHGCMALAAIASSRRVGLVAAGAVAGAVPSACAALRAHPGSSRVQRGGTHVFIELSWRSAPSAASAALADALELVLAAMGTHLEEARLQCDGCFALTRFCDAGYVATAACQARVVAAVVAAMRAHERMASVQNNACGTICDLATRSARSLASARAAGAVEVVVRAASTCQRRAFVDAPPEELVVGIICALAALLATAAVDDADADAAQDAAVRAGAQECVAALAPVQWDVRRLYLELQAALARAAQRHDAAPCAHTAACARCAAARAAGKMCALPCCGARSRRVDDAGAGTAKKLLRCARCVTAAYCCSEHQRIDWKPRHQAECGAAASEA